MKYLTIAIRALLTLAFIAAGAGKLAGAEMMVATFDTIGIGQWFRYLTGLIEVGGAIALWLPAARALAAALLLCTMAGAALAHVAILGPSVVPALVLGVLSGYLLYDARNELPGFR